METVNAVIRKAIIEHEDRGILQCWLDLDYGGTGQGFGGYALYLPKSFSNHNLLSPAGHFIFRCMEIAGAGKWDSMVGKTIRVKRDHSKVHAIGHIIKDDWFCPEKDFENID